MCIEGIDHICCSNQGEILIKKMEIDVEIERKERNQEMFRSRTGRFWSVRIEEKE